MNQPTRQGHVPKSVKKGNPKFECFNESMQNTMKLYNINLLLFQSSNATLHNLLVCCYSLGLFRLNRGTCKLLNLMTKWWAWKQKLQVIGGNHTMYDWKTLVDLHRFTVTKSAFHCGSSDICTTKVVDEANKPRELDDSKRRRLCFGFSRSCSFLSFLMNVCLTSK